MIIYISLNKLILNEEDVSQLTINYNVFTKLDENSFKLQLFSTSDDGAVLQDELIVNIRDFTPNNSYEIIPNGKNYYPIIDNDVVNTSRLELTKNSQVMTNFSSLTFYVPTNPDDECIIVSRIPIYFTNVVPTCSHAKFGEVVSQMYPEYKNIDELNKLKGELLLKLDPNNSLAYLEAQLDFVTKVLLSIVEKEPYLKQHVLEAVQQYSNFKYAFEKNNIFTVKDEMKCYEEILKGKEYVRINQKGYYDKKNSLNDGDNNGI